MRPALLALYRALDVLGARLLSAIAIDLDLPADWFDDKVDHGNSILRPLHYPPLRAAAQSGVRPNPSPAFTFAPRSSRKPATSIWPLRMAITRGLV